MKPKRRNILIYLIILYGLITTIFFAEAILIPSLNYHFSFIGYGGTFRYSTIELGSYRLSPYWLAYLIGIIGMILVCRRRSEAYRVSKAAATIIAVLLFVTGFTGAKLLYIFENLHSVLANGISFGGVSFFGAVFFLPVGISLMALVIKKRPDELLDYCTPAILVMLICIRTGCFLRGCCHGITFWAFQRPVVIPSQLLECTLDLLLLDGIYRFERSGRFGGKLYAVFMGGYGMLRFFVEFTRDTAKDVLFLSHGQWFSILCIILCVIVLHTSKNRDQSQPLSTKNP